MSRDMTNAKDALNDFNSGRAADHCKNPDAIRHLLSSHDALQNDVTELKNAAQAVIDRWNTPLWKDVEATVTFINRLQSILAKVQR